ncbi:hypothetical protein ACHAXS_003907 [Conticribra weissflogii]
MLPTISSDSSASYQGHAIHFRLGLAHEQCSLFEPCDFSLVRGKITGIVGWNGSGKTSLAKVIASKEIPGFPQDISIQYVSSHENYAFDEQEHEDLLPKDYIAEIVNKKMASLKEEIAKLEGRLGEDVEDVERIANRLAELCDTQEELESTSAKEIQQMLSDLAFQKFLKYPVRRLSSGWRYKCRLAAAFSSHPDILILDEPSFLDANSLEWMVEKCNAMADDANAMVVIISHKALLLDKLCDRILYINSANNKMTFYNCGYEEFLATREANTDYAERTLEVFDSKLQTAKSSLKNLKDHLQRRETNFKKASFQNADQRFVRGKCKEAKQKADRSAASKLKQIRSDVDEMEELKRDSLKEQFRQLKVDGYCSGSTLAIFDDVTFAYPNESSPIIQYLDARIESTDRILLTGENGCGKTTFLRLLVGELEPTDGKIMRDLDPLYFPQTSLIEMTIDHADETAVTYLDCAMTQTDLRHHLGDFGIADIALRPVAALSAGQRVRLWLAKQQLHSRRPSLLILDEISENMDYESRNMLSSIVNSFVGAAILVSHDADFCAAFQPTQVWEMRSFGQFAIKHTVEN